ncbi:MAG: FecR domain-containing protein [Tannerellaceae bacterium]|jgi:ferric-dicitrate binding protein FerR (iron transport regulator)|nr:FecR domain-containing protein [Tannerellaceae bacterium]
MYTEEKNKDIDDLLVEYFSGNTNGELLTQLERRMEESEETSDYVRTQLEIWFSSGVAGNELSFDAYKAYMRYKQRISKAGKPEKTARAFPWKMLYRAVAVILILLLPLVGYWGGKETVKQTFADVVVEVPMGARTKLSLPDGTAVWLNAGSRIVYSQGFGVDDRKLRLEGEGYFEVVKDDNKPFEIKTQELNLRVVGTKFNLKNYPDDEEVTVNLLEGKVALTNILRAMPELYLEPEERIVLNKRTGIMKKSKTDVTNTNAWARNELYFDEELLEVIAKKLMRSYDVKIEVADSLRNKRFYGYFKITGNNVDDVLKAMASTNQMKYTYKNDIYILY